MLDTLFRGLFDNEFVTNISLKSFLICVGCALLCGIILSLCYIVKAKYTRSFATTLALIPAIVTVIIMVVNGNIGIGVAVAGAFSLVRFRSLPGTAREIGAIFIAMGTGLVAGMGYVGYAILISILFGAISLIYNLIGFGTRRMSVQNKVLRITIPESLDYTDVFEPILEEYTRDFELVQVKTTNMGSLFRLTYNITTKSNTNEKEMIDKLRVRNGNLEITLSRQETGISEL